MTTTQSIISIPKTAENFQALYIATGLVDKKHNAPYRKYLVVQDKCYYATNTKALISVAHHEYDTIEPGFYQIITRTKQKIEMVFAEEIDNNVPDYDNCLSTTEKHQTTYLSECISASTLFYSIVKETGLCFDFKYISMLYETGDYQEVSYLENSPLIIKTDIFSMVIMTIKMEA